MVEAATAGNGITVLLADDHDLFVEAVEALLGMEEGIEVVGEARDGRRAVELAQSLGPDVVLMDISMPVMDGIEATRRIREQRPGACVVILTGSSSSHDVQRAREAGAAAYVTKDRISAELVPKIREVAER